jgi:hypothetical protein
MPQSDFVFKVALPPDRIESGFCSFVGRDQRRSHGDRHGLAGLDVDPNVLHDRNVKLLEFTKFIH